jgi:ribose transport system ATP-binding protein
MDAYGDTLFKQQTPQPALVQMRAITKRFPGVLALCDVDFDVLPGEVHALVGENGAGKSTLMKILAGVYTRDSGEVVFQGQPVHFTTPRQAQVAGITTIYQELNQVPQLSVGKHLPRDGDRRYRVNWAEMHRRAKTCWPNFTLKSIRTQLGRLGVAQQQMVESRQAPPKASLIIMDEPTSS